MVEHLLLLAKNDMNLRAVLATVGLVVVMIASIIKKRRHAADLQRVEAEEDEMAMNAAALEGREPGQP